MARRCSAWLACSAINFKFRWLHILRLCVPACYRLLLESSENALVLILSDALAATLRLPLLSTEPATMALAVELTSDAKGGFLGKGGFGVVRRGVLKESGEPIAVKELDLAALQRRDATSEESLLREVAVMELLQHAHIIQMFGWVREGDTLKLYLELLEGKSTLTRTPTPTPTPNPNPQPQP